MHMWNVFDTFDEASNAAADYIANLIEKCIQENNICRVILPGGNSPKACLAAFATRDLLWSKVHWYLGDEGVCPQGHEDCNGKMLREYLWSRIGKTNVHTVLTELGAERAADLYRKLVDEVEQFDIAFLGLGEDGHTASLFPGNPALDDSRSVVPVYHSPKPPATRVSMGINTLKKAKHRIVLTGGPGKTDIIARIKNGESFPINRIGDIDWFLDSEAAS